jgi:hypothetical protein
MSAIITSNNRIYSANQFINSFNTKPLNEWTEGVSYALGDVVFNSNRKYVAATSGTAGAIEPTHTIGSASDGSVMWMYVENISNNSFYNNNIYIGLGKTDSWRVFTDISIWQTNNNYVLNDIISDEAHYYICTETHDDDSIITGVTVGDNAGTGYVTGEQITLALPQSGGTSAVIKVTTQTAGVIDAVEVVSYGVGYTSLDADEISQLSTTGSGTGATFDLVLDGNNRPFNVDTYTTWATSTPYAFNDVVLNSGVYYRCLLGHTSSSVKTDEPFDTAAATVWVDSTLYSVDDVVKVSTSYYICKVQHTGDGAGSNNPTTDTTNWLNVDNALIYWAKQRWVDQENDGTYASNGWSTNTIYPSNFLVKYMDEYYLSLQETTSGIDIANSSYWYNITTETPLVPENDFEHQYQYLSDIIAAKKVMSTDVSLAVKRVNWASGTVYDTFDPSIDSFGYTNDFYVLNSENNIYKCVDNNRGAASISEPTGQDVNLTTTSDGYTWKFMGEVDSGDAVKFLSYSYLPVKYRLSPGSAQYNTQQNAKFGSLSAITVTAGGSGYTSATVNIGAPDQPGGIQATATAILNGGVVDRVSIINPGSGYTVPPTVSITGNGVNAVLGVVLAPINGHGYNILEELGAKYVIINKQFSGDEGGYFPVSGEDFRQLIILVDPKNGQGAPCTSLLYKGPSHESYTGTGIDEFKRGSGTIMYVENIPPVVRQDIQIEDFKVILKY